MELTVYVCLILIKNKYKLEIRALTGLGRKGALGMASLASFDLVNSVLGGMSPRVQGLCVLAGFSLCLLEPPPSVYSLSF